MGPRSGFVPLRAPSDAVEPRGSWSGERRHPYAPSPLCKGWRKRETRGSEPHDDRFLATQRNALGHFRLADDKAIVATFNPDGAGYATFPVTNVWGITPDPRAHQNSLNTAQAVRNPDGTVTVVLSNWDPGVANWIDPGGLRGGIVMLRWQLLGQARSTSGPAVTARLVERDAGNAALPGGVARFTVQQRAAQIARRA